jgi:hypothetical protein
MRTIMTVVLLVVVMVGCEERNVAVLDHKAQPGSAENGQGVPTRRRSPEMVKANFKIDPNEGLVLDAAFRKEGARHYAELRGKAAAEFDSLRGLFKEPELALKGDGSAKVFLLFDPPKTVDEVAEEIGGWEEWCAGGSALEIRKLMRILRLSSHRREELAEAIRRGGPEIVDRVKACAISGVKIPQASEEQAAAKYVEFYKDTRQQWSETVDQTMGIIVMTPLLGGDPDVTKLMNEENHGDLKRLAKIRNVLLAKPPVPVTIEELWDFQGEIGAIGSLAVMPPASG